MNKIVIGPMLAIAVLILSACMPIQAPTEMQGAAAGEATAEEKIAEAMLAAGAAVSKEATILDWPADPDGEFTVLREGTNGWTCLPAKEFLPKDVGHPMCVDDTWLPFMKAQAKLEEAPEVASPGVAYMLDGGGGPSSTDPYATEPAPGQDYAKNGPPHLMLLTPGELSSYTQTPGPEPWSMYGETQFAHLMVAIPMPDNTQGNTVDAITGDAAIDAKIAEAMRAAGPAISKDATILDWPTEPGGEFTVLREGTNRWFCIAPEEYLPEDIGHSICMDEVWLGYMKAKLAHEELPPVTVPGIAYMLDGGGGPSVTDPFATEPAPGEDWGRGGPHIMFLTPGDLSTFSRTPGPVPWVMFPDTSYAHLMITIQMPEK